MKLPKKMKAKKSQHIVAFIHIPEGDDPQYTDVLLHQLRKLLGQIVDDVLTKGGAFIKENWDFHLVRENWEPRAPWSTIYKEYVCEGISKWEQDIQELNKDKLSFVGIMTDVCGNGNRILTVSAYGEIDRTICRMPEDTQPTEKRLWIDIPYWVWGCMDHTRFIESIKEAICALKASYACVDLKACAPFTIFELPFILGKRRVDPEHNMPGIYWAQYVSREMLEAAGPIERILDEVPCEKVHPLANGLWMQTSEDILCIEIPKRLALRDYLIKALYPMDFRKLVFWINEPFGQDWTLLPISEEEWNIVEQMDKNNDIRSPWDIS